MRPALAIPRRSLAGISRQIALITAVLGVFVAVALSIPPAAAQAHANPHPSAHTDARWDPFPHADHWWWGRGYRGRIPICHGEHGRYVMLWLGARQLPHYYRYRRDIIPASRWGCPPRQPPRCDAWGGHCRNVPEVPSQAWLYGGIVATALAAMLCARWRRRRTHD